MREIKIDSRDNVSVNIDNGHKIALCDINEGENIIKYGCPIGHATCAIKKGDSVHTDNIKTNLSDELEYTYEPIECELEKKEGGTFPGYLRYDGSVGVRNELWIIPTVGCVNKAAQRLADECGGYAFTHPYGCSQLGDDHETTRRVLRGLVKHPNAGGVLVIGLGCENNTMESFINMLGDFDCERVRFLICQEHEDEISEGKRLISELKERMAKDVRTECPISKLKIGLKCGGSDGYSGITANPLVGRFSDMLIARGGSAVLTEVPEMFGAEKLLMARAENEKVFGDIVNLINNYKRYFIAHGQVVYENPSPGNKAGGISTLEDKSLGCTQKSGSSPVRGVLGYGDFVGDRGLYLLDGPGNDIVASTNLSAVGCQILLFTTGRGTPLGAPVPTVKIASNSSLAERKKNWIDFDASPILEGKDITSEFYDYVIRVASGEETKNEINGFREIAIFKDGVTL